MKKIFKVLGAVVASGAVAVSLASCSNVNQGFADKINEKYNDDDKENDYTYDDVMKKLGDEAIDLTIAVSNIDSGAIFAVKGVKSKEDLQKKIDAGDDVEGITVVILKNKATSATYGKITAEQLAKYNK